MNPDQIFQKALIVIDRKRDLARGEALLKEAAKEAEIEENFQVQFAAKVALSDLLYQMERMEECRVLLDSISKISVPPYMDKALHNEKLIIREISKKLRGNST